MNVEEYRSYCLSKKGVEESFPFDAETLVFKVMGKVFTIVPLERIPPQANLKCEPQRAEALREAYDGVILPGYHMNKRHWNTVHYSELPEKFVKELIDHSYDLIVRGLTKKLQLELANL